MTVTKGTHRSLAPARSIRKSNTGSHCVAGNSQTKILSLTTAATSAHPPAALEVDLNNPDVVRALLSATWEKERLHKNSPVRARAQEDGVEVVVVLDKEARVVEYGNPSLWRKGTASRIMHKELYATTVSIPVVTTSVQRASRASPILVPGITGPLHTQAHRRVSRDVPAYERNDPLMTAIAMVEEDSSLNEQPIQVKMGKCLDKGECSYQEDRVVMFANLNKEFGTTEHAQCSFFAVYDGHGGGECADFVEKHLHSEIASRLYGMHGQAVMAPLHAMREAFSKVDDRFIQKSRKHQFQSGCTAVTLLLRGQSLFVGHVGDSRAVLCRHGTAVALTADHKIEGEEAVRIHRDGGTTEGGRVGGIIAVARAIGDFDVGLEKKIPGLSCLPDLKMERVTDEDEFIVIASDGIWDVMDNAAVVHFVRDKLQFNRNDPTDAATWLIDKALEKGSSDNCGVAIVCLKDVPPPPERPRLMFRKPVKGLYSAPLQNIISQVQEASSPKPPSEAAPTAF